jgi:hypothetical protein
MREASDSESQQWRANRVKRVEASTMDSKGPRVGPTRRTMRVRFHCIERDRLGRHEKRSELPVINWTVVIVDVEEYDDLTMTEKR